MKNIFNRFVALSSVSLVGTLGILATAPSAKALTFVLDFNDPTQGNTTDNLEALDLVNGTDIFESNVVTTFDVTDYGFTTGDFNTVTNSVLNKVESHFYDIPTASNYSGTTTSPIPDGKELDIDFEIGDYGTAPSNGDSEHYFVQIGEYVSGSSSNSSTLGVALGSAARASNGFPDPYSTSPNVDTLQGEIVTSVFSGRISGLVTAFPNDLDATTNAIAGTLSHEIAHTLSLNHVYKESSETEGGVPPLMGTGALDLPASDRISERSFSFAAFGEESSGDSLDSNFFEEEAAHILERGGGDQLGDPFAPLEAIPAGAPTLNNVSQLVDAIGTRDVASASVPFEFSPGMGIFLVGGTWGIASFRKKSQLKNQLKK